MPRSGIVKGFRIVSLRVFGRLPVTGARACTEAGVRKASREETAGEFALVVLSGYGDLTPAFDLIFRSRIGTALERALRVVSVAQDAKGRVMSRRAICVLAMEGGADGCRRLSVGVTGEIPASDRCSGGG